MKNFIITAGALLLILTIMQYQFQLNHLLRQKADLKYAADEAAASAGLCYDEEGFGDGVLRFDRRKAEEKAGEMIRLNLSASGSENQGDEISWALDFDDEEKERPKVTVSLRQGRLLVRSEYEHVPYSQSTYREEIGGLK